MGKWLHCPSFWSPKCQVGRWTLTFKINKAFLQTGTMKFIIGHISSEWPGKEMSPTTELKGKQCPSTPSTEAGGGGGDGRDSDRGRNGSGPDSGRIWARSRLLCSGDPCFPSLSGPYFKMFSSNTPSKALRVFTLGGLHLRLLMEMHVWSRAKDAADLLWPVSYNGFCHY